MDINCDMGEGFGAYTIGDDMSMLDVVTTANVACGFHGGDPEVMAATMAAAKARGVAVGAHPGFPDLWGFGRRRLPYSTDEIVRFLVYQIGAAVAMATLVGHKLTSVKAHGALGNMASEELEIARAVAKATKAVDANLALLVMGGTQLERAGNEAGLRLVYEIYADRAYADDGQLVSRKLPGAVIHDPDAVVRRVVDMVAENAVISTSGKRLPTKIESVCVHGDTPGAVAIGRAVRTGLEGAGIRLRSFAAA
ncbi:MAG: 5-oxoprolinase subunit PxpA [Candidatus Eremiobacteraeota bacterium]|nr:5-oxoprolinase subunit PxpA [Candidatus Eremiobacteraeota bacterium]